MDTPLPDSLISFIPITVRYLLTLLSVFIIFKFNTTCTTCCLVINLRGAPLWIHLKLTSIVYMTWLLDQDNGGENTIEKKTKIIEHIPK